MKPVTGSVPTAEAQDCRCLVWFSCYTLHEQQSVIRGNNLSFSAMLHSLGASDANLRQETWMLPTRSAPPHRTGMQALILTCKYTDGGGTRLGSTYPTSDEAASH